MKLKATAPGRWRWRTRSPWPGGCAPSAMANTSMSMSGEASITSPRWPLRSCRRRSPSSRKASIVSQPPIEWASTWILPTPGVWPRSCKQPLERVARGGRAVLVGDVAEAIRSRRPGEQDRHAAETASAAICAGAPARLLEACVEAVHEDENVAVDADAARTYARRARRGTRRRRARARPATTTWFGRIARPHIGPRWRPRWWPGGKVRSQRIMRPSLGPPPRRRAALALAGRGDEYLHHAGAARRRVVDHAAHRSDIIGRAFDVRPGAAGEQRAERRCGKGAAQNLEASSIAARGGDHCGLNPSWAWPRAAVGRVRPFVVSSGHNAGRPLFPRSMWRE